MTAENALLHRVLNRLTPGRARIAVSLYGLSLFLKPVRYSFDRKNSMINYRSFFDAFFRPRKSVWVSLLAPSELVTALGLTPLIVESVGGVTGTLGLTRMFLRHTMEMGVPSSLCTFHRAHLSVVLKNGFYPPGGLLAVSALCDGNLRAFQQIGDHYSRPLFFIDVPEPDSPGAEAYLKGQIEETYLKMAERFRVADPVPRLRRSIETAEETRVLIVKVNELRKSRYLPGVGPMSMAWHLLNQTAQFGSLRGLAFYRKLYEALNRRGEKYPGECLKIILMHLPPTYAHPVFDVLSERGAVIAMEEFNSVDWPRLEPEDPFGSIARKLLAVHMLGSPRRRIHHINRLAEDYGADGIINFAHWGCRQSWGSLGEMKEKIGTPLLSLDTDLVDSESSSAGQIKTRTESFMEMLRGRR